MPRIDKGRKMHADIAGQPDAVMSTLASETDRVRKMAQRLRDEDIRNVLLVARGTSDNASMYARYAFSVINHKLACTMGTSLATIYDVPFDFRNALVLGISQSGQSAGVVETLRAARERGALTCALTNSPDSEIEEVTEYCVWTRVEEEPAVPPTKTYTAALAIVHQLATLWAGDPERARGIYEVPDWMREVLKLEDEIVQRADRYRYMEGCAIMGRGLSLCSALEAALKFAECARVVPTPYSGVDFLHGPIASIDPGFPCFVFAPEGNPLQSMSEMVDVLEERQAETIIISNNTRMLDRATIGFRIPHMPEEFAPMVEIIVGQLLALHIAAHKGIDPDTASHRSSMMVTL